MLVTLRDYRVKTVRPIDKNPSQCLGVAGSYFVQTKKQTLGFPSAKPHMETCTS